MCDSRAWVTWAGRLLVPFLSCPCPGRRSCGVHPHAPARLGQCRRGSLTEHALLLLAVACEVAAGWVALYACVLGQQAQGGVKAEMWMGQVLLLVCRPWGCRQLGLSPRLGAGPAQGAGLELQHAERGWQGTGTVGRPQSCWECPSTRHV